MFYCTCEVIHRQMSRKLLVPPPLILNPSHKIFGPPVTSTTNSTEFFIFTLSSRSDPPRDHPPPLPLPLLPLPPTTPSSPPTTLPTYSGDRTLTPAQKVIIRFAQPTGGLVAPVPVLQALWFNWPKPDEPRSKTGWKCNICGCEYLETFEDGITACANEDLHSDADCDCSD